MNTNYTQACKAVKDFISAQTTSEHKLVACSGAVRAYFVTADAMENAKAQFIADAIIPALPDKAQKALAKELPRKGSKEYKEWVAHHTTIGRETDKQDGEALWDAANRAKRDARAMAHTYFARVMSYAFPKEKTEAAPRDLKTRINEEIAALVKACQKAEGASFDIKKTITGLEAVLAIVNK